ncbi:unnamed protein product [Rotaria sp. Silwood1]|nr:unnamed protein product [Rotaria sp. Silwood1]CAF5039583.1 unnamed protein product [Rotaria sp. Silwood1]
MVCDHVLYRTVVQTAFFLGIMAGEMFFGTMSDSRFLLVGSVRGIIETGFVLVTELVIPKKRIMTNAVMNYVYVLEQADMALLFPETLNRSLPQTVEEVDLMGLAFGILRRDSLNAAYVKDDGPAVQELTENIDSVGEVNI